MLNRINRTCRTVLAATMVFTLVAACDGGGNTPTDADYDEVATTMGALIADRQHGEVASMGEATLIAQGSMPPTFTLTGDIVAGVRLGLAISYTITCRDAEGAVVVCGESATSARVQASWKGDWSSARVDASSDFKGDWTFEGLDEPVVMLNGKADAKLDVTVRSETATRSWKLEYGAAYHDVAIDSDTRLAVSGSATYDLKLVQKADTADTDTQEKLSVKGVVTFNADGTASILLDGKHKYKVNADGSVVLMTRSTASY